MSDSKYVARSITISRNEDNLNLSIRIGTTTYLHDYPLIDTQLEIDRTELKDMLSVMSSRCASICLINKASLRHNEYCKSVIYDEEIPFENTSYELSKELQKYIDDSLHVHREFNISKKKC